MKIVILNFYGGLTSRGLETFIDALATRLAPKHDVILYQAGPVISHTTYIQKQIPVPIDHRLPDNKYPFFWRIYLDHWSLKKKEFTQKVLAQVPKSTDILVATNSGWQSFLCRLWSWGHKVKLVIPGQSGKGWDDRINLLTHPDVFIALTGEQENWAKRWSLGTKIRKIPNGVDLKQFNLDVRPAQINLPRPIILCVAALEKDKNVDKTITAVSQIPKASLIIIGHGPEEKSLRNLAQAKLPGRHAMISVPHAAMPTYYRAADLFTMAPIKTESFGIVYLEALASGLPVVASDDPVRREIIGPAGLFVNPEDLPAYSQTIISALKQNWGQLPTTQAAYFSWDKIAGHYEQLFRALVSK